MKIDREHIQNLVAILETHRFDPEFHQAEYKALLTLKHIDSQMQKGWVFVPHELTAENGAKYALIGEFKEQQSIPCEYCDPKDDDQEKCELCKGTGEHTREIPVSWYNIKKIYAKAIELFTGAKANEHPTD